MKYTYHVAGYRVQISMAIAIVCGLVLGVTPAHPPQTTAQTAYNNFLPTLMLTRPIAFESNRDGSNYHELYLMNADGSGVIRVEGPDWVLCPAWSPDGLNLLYTSMLTYDLYKINTDGTGLEQLTSGARYDHYPTWSPDGQYIAFSATDLTTSGIYAMQPGRTGVIDLISSAAPDDYWAPQWSPDGRRIAFTSDFVGDIEIFVSDVITTSGTIQLSKPLVRLTNKPWTDSSPSWSPDGRSIVYIAEQDGKTEVWTMNADGSGTTQLTDNIFGESNPVWSPDGKKILFTTDREGSVELFVMNADGSNQVNLTSSPYFEGCASWR